MTEEEIKSRAESKARKIKKSFAKDFTDTNQYPKEDDPVSIFMAGAPGAGKTEVSIRLIEDFAFFADKQKIMRIDPDEFREQFRDCGYSGSNSYLFQKAVSDLVSNIHDFALKNNQSFIFDGTFSNIDKARENIQRSIKRNRLVTILYVYQEPKQSWNFVQKREKIEGRKILKSDFIDKYFLSKEVVNKMKEEFSDTIMVDLLIKNTDGSERVYKQNIVKIDNYIPEKYSKSQLLDIL